MNKKIGAPAWGRRIKHTTKIVKEIKFSRNCEKNILILLK